MKNGQTLAGYGDYALTEICQADMHPAPNLGWDDTCEGHLEWGYTEAEE
jgi:hypothetical protein